MRKFTNLVERKAKGPKVVFNKVQNRKRRKGKRIPTRDLSSKEEAHLIQEALNLTFECDRLHCRLFHQRCIQRQKSWNPEIYEGCIGCKQGLEVARKRKYKNKQKKAA